MSYTTADLLAAILRKSFAPTGQVTFSSTDLLSMADEILRDELVPDIMGVREEFYVHYKDEPIVAGQRAYNIPARAVGLIAREVKLLSSDGKTLTDLPRIEPEDVETTESGTPKSFYLEDNQVVIYPTPETASGSVRISFYLRPGRHVEVASAGLISEIDTVTNIVTVAAIPAAWATGYTFDLIKQDGGQQPLAIDLTSTLVTGSTITLPSLPTGLRVNDYVAISDQTPLPYVVPEYYSILAQGVAAQILENSNQPGGEKARDAYNKKRLDVLKLITPRVHGEDRVIVGGNWG